MVKRIDFPVVLNKAASLPFSYINRTEFLSGALKAHFSDEVIREAIAYTPAYAGIPAHKLKKIADACINNETTKVTGISMICGGVGGPVGLALILADLPQYLCHVIRIVQKLAYLYGWPDFDFKKESMGDEIEIRLTLFVGIMLGVNGANNALAQIAKVGAKNMAKLLAEKALIKGTIYPIVKKVAQILGVKMTRTVFTKGLASFFPFIGAILNGLLTFFAFKPMATNLRDHLAGYPCANVDAVRNNTNYNIANDALGLKKLAADVIVELDDELKAEDNKLSKLEKKYKKELEQIDGEDEPPCSTSQKN